MQHLERSCGAVVFTRQSGQPLFVVVQELAGAYSFPKGHMEGTETELETAQREVFEEIGIHPTFLEGFVEENEYDLAERPGTRKHVTYFLAEFQDETLIPRPGEIRGIQLLPLDEAMECFTHEKPRQILNAAYRFLMKQQNVAAESMKLFSHPY